MLTILHAADLHLDSPFRSLPAGEAARRRGEQREMLEGLRDLALERRVDLVLLAGDLFDGLEVYPETLDLLARVLGEMACPVVVAPGNHDFWGERSPYATHPWPENVHIFQSEAVAPLPLPEAGATVYGCAFTAEHREGSPLAGFAPAEDGRVPLLVVHGDVDGRGGYGPISREELAGSGARYAALGHIHQGTGLRWAGETAWAYPGCPQGRGFDETGDKGVLVVTVGDTVAAEFCPLPGPRYETLTVSVGEDPVEALLGALGRERENDYLRVTLTGEWDGLDLAALRRVGEPLCRVLELRDGTTLPRDLWARAGEETLTGGFLREMRARLEGAATPEERRRVELAVRYGLAALEGREAPT